MSSNNIGNDASNNDSQNDGDLVNSPLKMINLHSPLISANKQNNSNSSFPLSESSQRSTRRSLAFLSSNNGSPTHYSPQTKKEIYADRYIPLRTSNDKSPSFWTSTSDKNNTYNAILRKELFGETYNSSTSTNSTSANTNASIILVKTEVPILKYRSPIKSDISPFSLSPMSEESQRILSYPKSPPRKIPKQPFKILEASAIQDDFYLNLVDWSSQNILAVGLSNSVYLLNSTTGHVSKLYSTPSEGNEVITSVNWMNRGDYLALGTSRGMIQVWDVNQGNCVRTIQGHKHRVSALAWNSHVLSSGGRDRVIYHRDMRDSANFCLKLIGHKQEVCGLKWSFDGEYLASGGNDNKLQIWNLTNSNPLAKFADHIAAVKAIAWSPHQRGLLASGGGTADRCIRFWNVLNNTCLNFIDTGSQVCNLIWSKNVNELVSTHGFSQNQIVIWSYPSMVSIGTLVGHTMRVLYLAMSPDSQTIVTGAGDETLRFWNIFPKAASSDDRSLTFYRSDIR